MHLLAIPLLLTLEIGAAVERRVREALLVLRYRGRPDLLAWLSECRAGGPPPRGDTGEADSLAVAGRLYYWKPALALAAAGMLDELARAGVELAPPVADLGCGDGVFAGALRDLGLLERADVGVDRSLEDLRRTTHRPRLGVVRGDLAALPLASGRFGTALCLSVLNALEGGPGTLERAVGEIHRVLRPDGTAVITVSTPAFTEEAWPYKALLRLGLRGAAGRFARWLDRRNDHVVVRDVDAWVAAFERAGFAVERRGHPVSGRVARLQSWVALVPGADAPRRLGLGRLARWQASISAVLLPALGAGSFRGERRRAEGARRADARYLLLVVRRRGRFPRTHPD